MTTVRPGWTRTAGIGPKINSAWEKYYARLEKGAVGVDSTGNVIMSDQSPKEAEAKIYRPMIDKW
jgi:hypothetical protein